MEYKPKDIISNDFSINDSNINFDHSQRKINQQINNFNDIGMQAQNQDISKNNSIHSLESLTVEKKTQNKFKNVHNQMLNKKGQDQKIDRESDIKAIDQSPGLFPNVSFTEFKGQNINQLMDIKAMISNTSNNLNLDNINQNQKSNANNLEELTPSSKQTSSYQLKEKNGQNNYLNESNSQSQEYCSSSNSNNSNEDNIRCSQKKISGNKEINRIRQYNKTIKINNIGNQTSPIARHQNKKLSSLNYVVGKTEKIKKLDNFKILYWVNKFFVKMKFINLFSNPQNLNEFQLKYIGDLSCMSFGDGYGKKDHYKKYNTMIKQGSKQKKQKMNGVNQNWATKIKRQIAQSEQTFFSMVQKYNEILNCIPMIDEFNYFKQFWDLIQTIVFFLEIYLIPITIAFQTFNQCEFNTFGGWSNYMNYYIQIQTFVFYLLIIDIVVQSNTNTYVAGLLINKRSEVQWNYIRHQSLFDLVPLIVLGLSSYEQQWFDNIFLRVFILLYFIKYKNIKNILKRIEQKFILNKKAHAIFKLAQLLVSVAIITNIFSLIWLSIGLYQKSNNKDNWITDISVNNNCVDIYINAYYYATITITTVGFGDITPVSINEKMLVIILTLFSCANFGYTMNIIGSVLSDLTQRNKEFIKKIAQINQYLKSHNVNQELQSQAYQYIDYMYNTDLIQNQDPIGLIQDLSTNLKNDIVKDVYTQILNNISCLKNNFSKDCIEILCSYVQETIFGAQEYIIKQNINDIQILNQIQKGDKNKKYNGPYLYYIASGSVDITLSQRYQGKLYQKYIKTLKRGSYFGEVNFFTNNIEYQYNYISRGLTSINKIAFQDFQYVIEQISEDNEIFQQIRDQLRINQNYSVVQQYCQGCKLSDHLIHKCPYMQYIPKIKEIPIIYNEKNREFQQNFLRFRLEENKFNSLLNLIDLQISVEYYLGQYISEQQQSQLQQNFNEINSNTNIQASNKNIKFSYESQNTVRHQNHRQKICVDDSSCSEIEQVENNYIRQKTKTLSKKQQHFANNYTESQDSDYDSSGIQQQESKIISLQQEKNQNQNKNKQPKQNVDSFQQNKYDGRDKYEREDSYQLLKQASNQINKNIFPINQNNGSLQQTLNTLQNSNLMVQDAVSIDNHLCGSNNNININCSPNGNVNNNKKSQGPSRQQTIISTVSIQNQNNYNQNINENSNSQQNFNQNTQKNNRKPRTSIMQRKSLNFIRKKSFADTVMTKNLENYYGNKNLNMNQSNYNQRPSYGIIPNNYNNTNYTPTLTNIPQQLQPQQQISYSNLNNNIEQMFNIMMQQKEFDKLIQENNSSLQEFEFVNLFEKVKNYKIYFVHNNIEVICRKLKATVELKSRKLFQQQSVKQLLQSQKLELQTPVFQNKKQLQKMKTLKYKNKYEKSNFRPEDFEDEQFQENQKQNNDDNNQDIISLDIQMEISK